MSLLMTAPAEAQKKKKEPSGFLSDYSRLEPDPADKSILVYGDLTPDESTPSGYAWSSSTGPALRLTPGTTTRVRVVVEQRSPLSFILPILRESTGVD